MAQMIRKQIYINAEHNRFLKQRSDELGVSEAEIIRRMFNEAAARAERESEINQRVKSLGAIMDYITKHRTFTEPDSGWKFNREELYEDDDRFRRLYVRH